MKKTYFIFLQLLLICFFSASANILSAQQTVKGKVVDADDNSSLPGVVVVVKGTTKVTSTGTNGEYSISTPSDGILVFSMMGYEPQEIQVAGREVIDVRLSPEAVTLTETVVTALGIKREKKALSYAVQEVKADEILENRHQNIAGALSGKVAGLNISKTSTPGGSSRILIRGINSLNGNNMPLIVVDGIPYDNKQGTSGDVSWGGTDYGDGLSNLNQDDIESISVLKGPSASALYGSRAGNGVLLITTRKGSTELKGPRVNFISNFMVDRLMIQPEYQNEYGQGSLGEFNPKLRSSWGPKMDGRILTDKNSTWDGMLKGGNAVLLEDWTGRTGLPFVYHDNDLYHLLQTGNTWNNSVEINAGIGKTAVRASVSDTRSKGVIPNNEFARTSATLRASGDVIKNLSFDTKFSYTYQKGTNRPSLAVNGYNPMFGHQYVPRSIDLADFFPVIDPTTGEARHFESGTITLALNPYIATELKGNQDLTDRLFGFAQLKYQFTSWLNLMGRIGVDTYQYNVEEWYAKGSRISGTTLNGRFTNSETHFLETNSDFLLMANKDNLFDSKLSGSISFGGNIMDRRSRSLSSDAQGLNIDGLYTIGNGITKSTSNYKSNKQIQSLYSFAQLSWDGWLFLDVTGRNDWSSTLPKDNWSFFYPSVGIGWVVSDMLRKANVDIPSWISLAKVRASTASAGNDTNPYNLLPVYATIQNLPGGTTGVALPGSLPNARLKPEIVTSTEFGAEVRLFNNRFGIDFTYYTKTAKNQIFQVGTSATTGYTSKWINAGRIDNKGIEIIMNVVPIRTKDFSWDLTFNYAKNKSKIVELDGESDIYNMLSPGATQVDIKAIVGHPVGELFTTTRLTNSEGKYILNDTDAANYGTPTVSSGKDKYVGNMSPDWTGGILSNISYKGFYLNCLVDIRVGGYIYLNSMLRLNGNGATKETLLGRDSWYPFYEDYIKTQNYNPYGTTARPNRYTDLYNAATQAKAGVYVEGVGSNSGLPMAGYVNPQYYFSSFGQDHYFYEMTHVRLREISFGYHFPASWFKKTPIQNLKLSLVVNNVCFLYNKLPDFDPESTYTTGNAQGVETASIPSTRSIGFNLNISF